MKQLNDTKLKFNEEKHEYKIGKKKLKSVTEWIGQFFSPFDEETISLKMAKKRVGIQMPDVSDDRHNDLIESVQQEVLAEWKQSRDDGTEVHKEIEEWISDPILVDEVSKKTEQAMIYYMKELCKDYNFHSPEVKVYSEDLGLAGTIDLLTVREDPITKPRVTLIDWKTNKDIKRQNPWQKTKAPLEHLHDSSYVKYNLQLSVYAYILEQEYGYIIDKLQLIHLKEDSYEVINMDYLRETVKEMIKYD